MADDAKQFYARKLAFFDVLSQAPDLHHVDVRVAWRIVTRLNVNTNGAWPSFTTIAREIGVHRTTVIRSLHRLVHQGWLIKRAHRRAYDNNDSNIYWPNYEVVAHTLPPPGGDNGGGSTGATGGGRTHAPGVVAQVRPEPTQRTHPAEPAQAAPAAFEDGEGEGSTSPPSVQAEAPKTARQGSRKSGGSGKRHANPLRAYAEQQQRKQAVADNAWEAIDGEQAEATTQQRSTPRDEATEDRVSEAMTLAWQTLVRDLGKHKLMDVVDTEMLDRARQAEQTEPGSGRQQLIAEAKRAAAAQASEAAE